tara:strand:+ start:420 stop:608 length:189 start_codon:yes stop_codon:yes gene_type:complete
MTEFCIPTSRGCQGYVIPSTTDSWDTCIPEVMDEDITSTIHSAIMIMAGIVLYNTMESMLSR